MVKRIQVKPRAKRTQPETEGQAAQPVAGASSSPDSGFKIKVLRKQKPLEIEPSSSPAVPPVDDSVPAEPVDVDPGWEDQAEKLANQLLGPPASPAPVEKPVVPTRHPEKIQKRAAAPPKDESSPEEKKAGDLQFRKKKEPGPVTRKKKREPVFSFSLPGVRANLVSAVILFLAGNVLLAFSMFGFGNPFKQFNSISLIGICVAEGLFILSTLHSGEVFATFSRTLVGAFTLFSALTAVGVFMAEVFLVPSLGFKLVKNMPSAPLTASATFVFSACLILNARTGKTKWWVVLICLLAATAISLLPVQHFVSAHIDEFTLDRLQHLF